MRDDFTEEVKKILAQRVGSRCSNPNCKASTSGPHTDHTKALNVGVASHITSASSGGPRYNASLTSEERKHANNGIWLCQTCGKLVDNDEINFTEDIIRHWKKQAEEEALSIIGKAFTFPSTHQEIIADTNSPLQIKSFVFNKSLRYPPGINVYGIQWNENYTDVRFNISNSIDLFIQEIDLLVELDTSIAEITQVTNIPDIVIFPFDSIPSIVLSGLDDNGNEIAIPVVSQRAITSPRYRIYCPELLPKCEINFLIVSIALNSVVNGQLPDNLFAPKRIPSFINIQGSYIISTTNTSYKFYIKEQKLYQ